MKALEILHLATYESFGGAARATKRIYHALKAQPILCHMFTMLKTSEDESILVVQPKDPHAQLKYIHALLNSIQKQKLGQSKILESYGDISAGIVDEINAHQAPLIHLHWISNLLSIEDIGRINKPIIWTLHDMWPFIGSEHYTHDLDAFFHQHPSQVHPNDNQSIQTFKQKHESWQNQKFTLVSPSHWLAEYAKRSILFSSSNICVIPYPVDHIFWSPQNPLQLKRSFKFDRNKKQILFIGPNLIVDDRKGWDLLKDVLSIFYHHSKIEFELVVVGHTGELKYDCPYTIHSLGEIADDDILVDLFSSVDLLVVPSKSEAFSQVTLEAQSCGLPVVGFNIGGIPDILIHKKTGWISAAFDLVDFSKGIEWILNMEGRSEKLGLEGRKNVTEKFSSERVSRLYYDLYQQIISERKGESRTDF